MLDKMRTRLRDIAFGRTKIKIIELSNVPTVQPIFLVGTFRSGTTLLRYILDSHSHICCPPETKFQNVLAGFRNVQNVQHAFAALGLEESYIRSNLQAFASRIYDPYMKVKGKPILVDKTPEYVRCIDFLDWLYEGKAKYIVLFRNGLDVAKSMSDIWIDALGKSNSPETAFEYWREDAHILLDWLEREPLRTCKVVYDELCDTPRPVIERVLGFIGEEFEETVMEWYNKEHDRGDESNKARRQRRFNKSVGNYEVWGEEVVAQFKSRSESLHCRIGFDPNTLVYDPD